MRSLFILLVIVVVGGAIFSPLIMQLDLPDMPGDFAFDWNHQHFAVPVLWSLCASSAVGLLYWIVKR
jgi:hypothetical protein